MTLSRRLSLLYTYAHLRYDEEITHDNHKSAHSKLPLCCMISIRKQLGLNRNCWLCQIQP